MSYFLWIEDFAVHDTKVSDIHKVTATQVFGGILNESIFSESKQELKRRLKEYGIFIELDFQSGWRFIREDLAKIDYVILDIDLPAYSSYPPDDDVKRILKNYYKCSNADDETLLKDACAEIKKVAGFHLYTELVVELGFPKDHILFVSHHGKEQESLKVAFKEAKISPPEIYDKTVTGSDHNPKVRDWIKEKHQSPYSRLRRGIIEGCRTAKNLQENKLYFNKYTNENEKILFDDIKNYFQILEEFLPLREPEKGRKKDLYKLFVRTLSHEWEAAKCIRFSKEKEDAVLARIMRNTRHWVTHNSSLYNDLDEKLIAFLFIVNIRVMFNFENYELLRHEEKLLKLFDKDALPDLRDTQINSVIRNAYLDLRNKIRDERDERIEEAFYFPDMANNIQLSKSMLRNDKPLFAKLLFQMFWLTTCNPYVDRNSRTSLEIRFRNFNYSDKPYLRELARHIYRRSFPEV